MPTPISTPAFDTFVLAAVADEVRRTCVGARIQKVRQPTATDVLLLLYGPTGARTLLLCADPQNFRVHLTQQRRENPVTPPGFCQVCRKYLEGALLTAVTMPHFDRTLHLVFQTAEGEPAALVVELMGRNANVFLTTGSGKGTVRGILRPLPPTAERLLRPGQAYADPPGYRDRVDPLQVIDTADPVFHDLPPDTAPDDARAWLAATFSGIGRFGAAEIVARSHGTAGIAAALVGVMDEVRGGNFAPHTLAAPDGTTVGVWAFEPKTFPPERRFPRESVSVALDTFYATMTARVADDSERDKLTRTLAKEIAYREKEVDSARATLAEADRADSYERIGNNLLAQMATLPRGTTEATLPDLYADDPDATVTVTLDPKRSPHENAEAYFSRARKAREAAAYADGRIADLTDDLIRLRALAERVAHTDEGASLAPLQQVLGEIIGAERAAAAAWSSSRPAASAAARPKEKPFGGHRIRTYTVEGFDLLIGETAEANDYLTTRAASPSDLWFHVRAAPGAHGILRTNGHPERIPDTIVRRAAQIVAARSGTGVKHASLVAVDVTEKRHVRKPRGAKPGLVSYSRERVLDVEPKL